MNLNKITKTFRFVGKGNGLGEEAAKIYFKHRLLRISSYWGQNHSPD